MAQKQLKARGLDLDRNIPRKKKIVYSYLAPIILNHRGKLENVYLLIAFKVQNLLTRLLSRKITSEILNLQLRQN